MNIKDFFKTNLAPKIILILSILLVALLIFQAGVVVGYRKGVFSNNWNKNYTVRGIDDPHSFLAPFMQRGDGLNPHGAVGEIISINPPEIMIKGPGRAEEMVIVNQDTEIRNMRQIASTTDLGVGKFIVVIGSPNDKGEINASLIRIVPTPPPRPDMTATTTETN